MSDKLISADALREEMNEYILPLTTNNLMGAADVFHRTAHLLEEAPALDAVEVVRCKDCKSYLPANHNFAKHCQLTGTEMDEDGFCSYGERREGNEID